MIGGDYILGKRADWGIHSLNADLTRFFQTNCLLQQRA